MSVKLMSAIWELQLLPTDKLVMLALADCANDEGHCWPSIATIARKSGVSERSVQRAIRKAEEAKLLHRQEVIGKGCKYRIDPRHCVTPDTVSPPTDSHPTPDTVSPKPSRTINTEKAKASSVRAPDQFPRPEWADRQVWADFLTNRKRKHLSNTPTAYKGFLDDVARLADDDWPPGRLLELAARKGWGSINKPDTGNGHGRYSQSSHEQFGTDSLTAIALQKLGNVGPPA